MRISDWSSDVCSSDLLAETEAGGVLVDQDAGHALRPVATGPAHHRVDVARAAAGDERLAAVEHVVRVADLVGTGLQRRGVGARARFGQAVRSEEHTSELQSLMRISYAVFCLKKKKKTYRK